jgi:antitoxin VapB
MAFHIRDPETDALVRELARRDGTTLTEAVRETVRKELKSRDVKLSLWDRTADIRARLNAHPDPDFKADKAFFDDLWGQGDD